MTWLMRSPVDFSTPFMSETSGTSVRSTRGRMAARFSRSDWLGTDRKICSAPFSASARSVVAVMVRGRLMPER